MGIIEILIIIFACFALIKVVLKLKDKAISWREFGFWAVIWTALVALVLLRKRLGFLGELSGVDDPFKTVVILSIILLFYLMFRTFIKIDKVEQEITRLTREIAIKKVRKK